MSGGRGQKPPTYSVALDAITVLVEAQGEVRVAEGQVEALLVDEELNRTFLSLTASIHQWFQQAFRSTSLESLQVNLEGLDQAVQEFSALIERVQVPPLSSYVHQLQLARDWLGVSRGKIKVALTYARLHKSLKAQAAPPRWEN